MATLMYVIRVPSPYSWFSLVSSHRRDSKAIRARPAMMFQSDDQGQAALPTIRQEVKVARIGVVRRRTRATHKLSVESPTVDHTARRRTTSTGGVPGGPAASPTFIGDASVLRLAVTQIRPTQKVHAGSVRRRPMNGASCAL